MSDKKPQSKRRALSEPTRSANYADVRRALNSHGAKILEQIPLTNIQLSQPIDGGPPRILASVENGQVAKVPQMVEIKMGRSMVSLSIEAHDDYSVVVAQTEPG